MLHDPRDENGEWRTSAFTGAMLAAELVHIVRAFMTGYQKAGDDIKRVKRGRR